MESAHAGIADAYRVKQFREKPDAETAQVYYDSGDYYWNSGIFVWRADTILNAIERRKPQMYEHLAGHRRRGRNAAMGRSFSGAIRSD